MDMILFSVSFSLFMSFTFVLLPCKFSALMLTSIRKMLPIKTF